MFRFLVVTVTLLAIFSRPAAAGGLVRDILAAAGLGQQNEQHLDLEASPRTWNLESINHEDADQLHAVYQAYLSHHGRDFDADRLAIFKDNLEFIKKTNAEQSKYKLGLNKFADISFEEFERTRLAPGIGQRLVDMHLMEGSAQNTAELEAELEKAPSEVDWVKKGAVGPARDQGECGSCWAFGAIGATEAAVFKQTGELEQFSTQQMVSCSHNGGNDACDGGFAEEALKYAVKYRLKTEKEYPYKCDRGMKSSACRDAVYHCDAPKKTSHGTLGGFTIASTEKALLAGLSKWGPSAIVIHAERALQHYESGILSTKTCSSKASKGNHVVLAVGYDEETITIRNSWGDDFGVNGFFMVEKGVNACGIGNDCSFAFTKKEFV